MTDFLFVYVTCSNNKEAKTIAESALQKKLIACANIFPEIESIFTWQGEIKCQKEVVVILKTTSTLLTDLKNLIIDLHNYDCPCVLSFKVDSLNQSFSDFLLSSVS